MFRVLLPVDSNEDHALAAARVVTSFPDVANSISVTVLNVEKEIDVSDSGGRVTSEDWYDETDLPESVVRTVAQLEDAGVETEVRREHGDPATAIVQVANEIGADRIIMITRKRTPTGKVLFGSVTQSVLLNSTVPVTVSAR